MADYQTRLNAWRASFARHRLPFRVWQNQLDGASPHRVKATHQSTVGITPTKATTMKVTTMSNAQSTMLLNLVNQCDRAALLGLLSDESAVPTDVLRTLVFVGLGGDPATANGAAQPVAKASAKPAKPAKPSAPAKPAPVATGAAGQDIQPFIDAFVGESVGFAVGDLVAASGATKGRCSTAIKNAIAAGTLHRAGDRRFTRYGGTLAIATAASAGARNGG